MKGTSPYLQEAAEGVKEEAEVSHMLHHLGGHHTVKLPPSLLPPVVLNSLAPDAAKRDRGKRGLKDC